MTDAQVGHLYVIAFSNGTIKVGNTTDPIRRVQKHTSDAGAFGLEVSDTWLSIPHADWLDSEKQLLTKLAALAASRHRREYFQGVSFEDARTAAVEVLRSHFRLCMDEAWRLAEEGEAVGAVRAMYKAFGDFEAAEIMFRSHMEGLERERRESLGRAA